MCDIATATHPAPNYSAAHVPCLTVESGQTFAIETADRFAGYYAGEPLDMNAVAAVVGPVRINGISAGDLVAVEIERIEPATSYAYLMASGRFGLLGDRIQNRTDRIAINEKEAQLVAGHAVPYRPMIGKLGLAPPQGEVGSSYGDFGGALSNIHIGPGATVVLRAYHDGALLFLEDVHAGMGDGEATSSALEMAARVTLKCSVLEDESLAPPMILTKTEALTLGQGDDLDTATQNATDSMLDLIQRRLDVDLTQAAMVFGATVDLRIAFAGSKPKKVYAAVPRDLVGL
jgi:amidase